MRYLIYDRDTHKNLNILSRTEISFLFRHILIWKSFGTNHSLYTLESVTGEDCSLVAIVAPQTSGSFTKAIGNGTCNFQLLSNDKDDTDMEHCFPSLPIAQLEDFKP
ncbi:hypothetical protein TNCV_4385001 [Trichonephila clavipes]|nr:hypothetical protein TNCV_4385001 [Trichonephila clavipes]